MSEPVKKVTDAKLTECLAAGGGVCPFCGSDKAECLNSESQDDVVIEKWACCTDGCPGNVRGWTQILSLSEIYVSEDDVAEGDLMLLTQECTRLIIEALHAIDADIAAEVVLKDVLAAVRTLLPKES